MSESSWPGIRRAFPRLRRRLDVDIDEELRFHLDSRVDDLVRSGRSADDARREALAEFGDVDASRRELLSVDRRLHARARWTDRLDRLRQDIRWALRGFRREPGLAASIVLILALAVGANTAAFSLIDPIFFREPPGLVDGSSVRRLYTVNPGRDTPRHVWRIFSYAEYLAIRQALSGQARVAVFASRDSTLVMRESDSTHARVEYVTADYLPMLARAVRGRFFTEGEDDTRSPATVAVVGERFVARYFGPGVDPVGRSLRIGGKAFTVIGVAGGGFAGIEVSAVDLWLPFSANPRLALDQQPWVERGGVSLPLVLRLEPGADPASVEARASLAYAQAWLGDDTPPDGRGVVIGPLSEARGPINTPREVSTALQLAFVSGLLLLIAAANVANLLLARAIRRRRETATQLALGVSRRRLVRQHLVEALILASVAALAALVAGNWSGTLLRVTLLPQVDWISPALGLRLVAFTIAVTLAGTLLAAAIPALQAGRRDVLVDLAASSRDAARPRSPLRFSLLVAQAAMSMVLLAGAGLFLRSFNNVADVDMGVDVDRLVVASVFYDDRQRHPELGVALPEVANRLKAEPGIAGAAWGTGAPMYSWYSFVSLFEAGSDSAVARETNFIGVSGTYFDVSGTRITSGRPFGVDDRRDSPRVMIVSPSLARALQGDRPALGRCVSIRQATAPCHTIVGIAEDAKGFRRVERPEHRFYVPVEQMPNPRTLPTVLLVRTGTMAPSAAAAISGTWLTQALPGASITSRVATSILEPELMPWRRAASLLAILSALALAVAAIGVYSSVAFTTRQRTRELGVRLALGAPASSLLRLVVREGAVAVVVGVAVGVAVTASAGSLISAALFEVAPGDPLSLGVAGGLLLLVGVGGSLWPALRSVKMDPAIVLRSD